MRKYLSAVVMLIALCSLAVSGRAMISEKEDLPGIPSIPPLDHEAIRATVIDSNPAHYTIDVRKFSNIGVNEDAPTFAVYVTSNLPSKCGDFRPLDLPYWKPSKYKRSFDLRDHPDILTALKTYGCVVLRNMPQDAQG